MFHSLLRSTKATVSTLCIDRLRFVALQETRQYQHYVSSSLHNGYRERRKKEFRPFSTAQKDRPTSVETLIIGGGPIGASTAYHLARQRVDGDSPSGNNNTPSVLVVERDSSLQSGSAIYSAGGIRFQFSLEENVRMSLYGIDFLRNAESELSTLPPSPTSSSLLDIQYVENGYLFYATSPEGEQQLRENYGLYQKIGCADMVELLSPTELAVRFPWLNVDDILLGSFGCSGEGWFDPWAYIQALNDKSKSMGVQYAQGTVVAAKRDPDSGLVLSVSIQDMSSKEVYDVRVKNVVNAAGAAADHILGVLGDNSSNEHENGVSSTLLSQVFPVRPRKRSIYFFHCSPLSAQVSDEESAVIPDMAPLTIDNTGAYFRSEGTKRGTGKFLCGISPPSEEDEDCYDRRELDNAHPHLFERDIWPALYHRVPAFGSIKLQSSWAGLYEVNIVDHNCIIDFHPEMSNVLMVNGFSGHGLQHSPAAGRAAAELIDNDNRFETLNLDIFRFGRLLEGGKGPVHEKGIY